MVEGSGGLLPCCFFLFFLDFVEREEELELWELWSCCECGGRGDAMPLPPLPLPWWVLPGKPRPLPLPGEGGIKRLGIGGDACVGCLGGVCFDGGGGGRDPMSGLERAGVALSKTLPGVFVGPLAAEILLLEVVIVVKLVQSWLTPG